MSQTPLLRDSTLGPRLVPTQQSTCVALSARKESGDCLSPVDAIEQSPVVAAVRKARFVVPQLKNGNNIRIRPAKGASEVQAANQLVCNNYLEQGYWDNDDPFRNNIHMHSPARLVFVAEQRDEIVATVSIVKDSPIALPADKFQPQAMKRLRAAGGSVAEVSALAVSKECKEGSALVLFLFKYVYQYSFYYASIDSLVVVPTIQHVSFYKRVCGFQELSGQGNYHYVKPEIHAQLLVADLLQAHRYFYDRYEAKTGDRHNFYRFLLIDDHLSLQFPDPRLMRRRRDTDWLAQASRARMSLAG